MRVAIVLDSFEVATASATSKERSLVKFWLNNRLDGTFEVPIEQIAAQFRESAWWTADLDLESAVRGFLLDTGGPVSAVWDESADLAEVCAHARAMGWTGGAGERHPAVA